MKRLVKAVLKGAWRCTGPIRRPVARRYELFLKDRERAPELIHLIRVVGDSNALLDQVVRELVRLQRQTEYLQQLTEELSDTRDSHMVCDEDGSSARAPVAQRKAG